MFITALLIIAQSPSNNSFVSEVRAAVASGKPQNVYSMFAKDSDTLYLREMIGRKGLKGLSVTAIPSPPGWKACGPIIVQLHRWNQIEDDHDPVYGTILNENHELKLGPEIAEDASTQRIKHINVDAHIFPSSHSMSASITVELTGSNSGRAPLFRMNDTYRLTPTVYQWIANVDEREAIPTNSEGTLVKAGSLIIPWTTKPLKKIEIHIAGTLRLRAENRVANGVVDVDDINDEFCFLNSYWTPMLGRNPHTATIRVTAPKDWIVKSEGEIIPNDLKHWKLADTVAADEAVTTYQNNIPISSPKIVAGKYKIAAERHLDGKVFRSYQFEPLDRAAGEKVVAEISSAYEFYTKKLAPWPYSGYDIFQAKDHYGIESYSYTLEPASGYHFATHEMAHTYFGGVGACTYIYDSWNEGLADYLDSVLFKNNSDRVLQQGLASVQFRKPLSIMYFEWGDGGSSYTRGAYVMKMLEAEIGQDKVLEGLRYLLKSRIGKDTRWKDILPCMERVSGAKLGWFWDQWIDGAEFPLIKIESAKVEQIGDKYKTTLKISQSETTKPLKLRFNVNLQAGSRQTQSFSMSDKIQTCELETIERPTRVKLDILGLALGTTNNQINL